MTPDENPQQAGADDLIDVPDAAVVRCPQAGFKLTRVAGCEQCAHFAGLQDRFPGSSTPFAARHVVLCNARPTERQIQEVA